MTHIRISGAGWRRSARVGFLLGAIAATGCGSGDTVLEMPKGGPATQAANPGADEKAAKEKARAFRGISSRREREKQLSTGTAK
jgi:hypothetical protein